MTKGRGRPATYWMEPKDQCIDMLWRVYHDEGEIAQTARHYYYGLKRMHMIHLDTQHPGSGANAYKGVIRLLKYARKSGLFPYYAVIDTSRRSLGGSTGWDSLDRYINSMSKGYYSLDPWRGQYRRIEVFTEKDGMANFLYAAVKDWRIPVYVNKGYGSISMLREAALRYQDGSKWLLLYVGDFDPSGIDIQRKLIDTIYEHGGRPDIRRVALTQADLVTLDSDEQLEINPKDPRKKAFEDEYGENHPCYQVESMPAGVLRQKVEQVIQSEIDEEEFTTALQLEEEINRRSALALAQSIGTFRADLAHSEYIGPRHLKYISPPEEDPDNYSILDITDDDDREDF